MDSKLNKQGFTLIELLIAVAIIGILALVAIPAYQTYLIRSQVTEGITLAQAAKTSVADAFIVNGVAPSDREAVGMSPDASDTQGRFVSSVAVNNGVVTVTFGNDSSAAIEDLTLSLTPYETDTLGVVWRCGSAPEPMGLFAMGTAAGARVAEYLPPTVPDQYLPQACRE